MPDTLLTAMVALFGAAILVACLFGLVSPRRLCQFVNSAWAHPSVLYIAVGARLALGALLIAVAQETKFPLVFQCLGYVTIVAAILIPIVGRNRIGRVLAYFERGPAWIVRLWLCFGFAFGGFMIYSVL